MARYIIEAGILEEAEAYGHISKSGASAIRRHKVPVGARLLTKIQLEDAMRKRGFDETQIKNLVEYFFVKGGQ
jgi:hypothetical protein